MLPTHEAIFATMSGVPVYFYQVDEWVLVSLDSLLIREQRELNGQCAPGSFKTLTQINELALCRA